MKYLSNAWREAADRACHAAGPLLWIVLIGSALAAPARGDDPSARLPDGTTFTTWEDATEYKRTWYVAKSDPGASDDNTGTEAYPLQTIGEAARRAEPGHRVFVKAGIYRELVRPVRGGTGPDAMIFYEADPTGEVVIAGSRVVDVPLEAVESSAQGRVPLWQLKLPEAYFDEHNPFAVQNADRADIAIMPWASRQAGKEPYTHRRGLIFQDGRRLAQVGQRAEVVDEPGRYWVAPDGHTLILRTYDDLDPNACRMEVTTQRHLFKPRRPGLGYIRLRGFTFRHAGNGLPRTGEGAVTTFGGHHWLIEENTVHDVNSVGIEIGARTVDSFDKANPRLRSDSARAETSPGGTIVRGNYLTACGRNAVQGYVVKNALIEGNVISDIGHLRVEPYWETGGMKLLRTEKSLIRRNIIYHTTGAPGIWLDWDNRSCRITRNLLYDIRSLHGGIVVEASRVPNLIDTNIIWSVRGSGVWNNDSDRVVVAHNLIAKCTSPAVLHKLVTDRSLDGVPLSSKHNRVVNNLFYGNETDVEFSDDENTTRGNASVDVDSGWSFDPEEMALTWHRPAEFPLVEQTPPVRADYWGRPYQEEQVPAGALGMPPQRPDTVVVAPW